MTSGYYLISKITNLPYYKYNGDTLRLINQTARTIDEVVVGSKNGKNIKRKITTFRDSDGNIIERVFNYSDKPFKNRVYTKNYSIIGEDEFITSTHIKEYTLPRSSKDAHIQSVLSGYSRILFWTPVKFLTNHLSENIVTGDKILTQVMQRNLLKPQNEIHTFTEFPHIISGKISDAAKKILEFRVNTFNGNSVNPKRIYTQGTKLPQNDSFLGIRALSIDDSKDALTQRFLIERGLKNKRIIINPDYKPQDDSEELTKALFDPNKGSVNFLRTHKYKTKSEVCTTARHEVEHGWQYYLHARNTKGGTSEWEAKIYNIFRDLPKLLKKEAQSYTDSISTYVTVAEDREKYRQNFIEIKANEAGKRAKELYDNERAEIQKEFPHIPSELL